MGAYQYLLDYHLSWYLEHPTRQTRREIYQGKGGQWFLTTEEKKRILLNSIYGVDIDPQAVEVTKLSLLLKVLEGESQETIAQQLELFHERALPDLGANIKCGNSLIGPDFYAEQQASLFDQEEALRINAFDWQKEFPEVFARARRDEKAGDVGQAPSPSTLGESWGEGGFDVVIGNPPYVRQEMLGELKEYFQSHYQVYHGTADLYTYFIERGISLLRPGGLFSYIVANKWMRANYGEPLRCWLKAQEIEEIVDFGDLPVFETATTYPCIIRVRKGAAGAGSVGVGLKPTPALSVTQVETLDFGDLNDYERVHHYAVNRATLDDGGWSLVDERTEALLAKLRAQGVPLGQYVEGRIYYGIKTGLNEAFVINAETRERLTAEDPKSAELIKPFLAGRDVKRYEPPSSDRYLILIPRGWTRSECRGTRDAWAWFERNYPAIARHLAPFTQAAEKRYDKGEYWWELRACDYYAEFEKPKIVIPAIVQSASYAFDDSDFYSNDKTSIIPTDDLYFLGVLNSKVPDFVMRRISSTKQGGYFEYKPMYVSQLPIRPINFSDPADVARHERMVALVEQMLSLHRQLAEAKTPTAKTMLQRQIEATDQQIDQLVYELYGLTEEEVRIVEG